MFAEGRYNLSDLLDEQDQKPRSNAGARRCMPRRATPTRSFNLALLIQRNNRHEDAEEYGLSFPKIISGRSDDAIRLGLVWRRWSRIGSCHRLHLRHRLPHTQMFRDELGPHEHVGLLAARGTWLLAVVLAAVRRMMTAH